LDHVASFDAGLRTMAFPASEQEHRLRLLMGQGSTRLGAPALAAAGDPALDAGGGAMAARRSDRFTRFDGNLAGLAVPSPAAHPTSATRLETWAGCPFAYFLQTLLRVEEVENPEDQLQISPRDRGSLVHESLELFIVEVLARPAAEQPAPTEAWSEADRERLVAIGQTGRAVFWKRDKKRILADLERFLVADSAHRTAHGTRPVAAELSFGLPHSALGTIAMGLPDGRSLHFRGVADRVDVGDDGTIHVVDYKTGSTRDYGDLTEDNPDARGRRLQLAVYGQAARLLRSAPDAPVMAEYWFVSAQGKFDRVGYPVTAAVLDKVAVTLGTMVAGIEAGVFPHYPTASSTSPVIECPSCDPDGLGVTDLRRAYEAKSSDPAMAVFVELAEPLADTPLDVESEQRGAP
jgi:ATP-dependent helicase/nuclease subunit B